eukprot:TRINITY_DN4220_c0_g1_i2.p2 TRINITY_DN4220_c0_g1~~TRINITY_DN4220_c0_g1_i2.p2  ORF type:complete len:180 (+),score=54.01 TRINITY_DN4220_c0_g1_i2:59-541(+)
MATFKGQCHCGDCHFEVVGLPEWAAICHCSICRRTHSAPYAELCAYKNENLRITKGESNLTMYNVRGKSKEDRYFCQTCGGKVYSHLNHLGCKAVFLQNFTTPNHGADGRIDSRFAPGCHIFYGSGTVCFFDKLEKFETLPKAFGGDGKALANNHHISKL